MPTGPAVCLAATALPAFHVSCPFQKSACSAAGGASGARGTESGVSAIYALEAAQTISAVRAVDERRKTLQLSIAHVPGSLVQLTASVRATANPSAFPNAILAREFACRYNERR